MLLICYYVQLQRPNTATLSNQRATTSLKRTAGNTVAEQPATSLCTHPSHTHGHLCARIHILWALSQCNAMIAPQQHTCTELHCSDAATLCACMAHQHMPAFVRSALATHALPHHSCLSNEKQQNRSHVTTCVPVSCAGSRQSNAPHSPVQLPSLHMCVGAHDGCKTVRLALIVSRRPQCCCCCVSRVAPSHCLAHTQAHTRANCLWTRGRQLRTGH